MRHKYDSVTRKRVWGEISRLMAAGLASPLITEELRRQGIKLPDGKSEMTQGYVAKTMYHLHKTQEQGAVKISPAPKIKSDRLPQAVLSVLTDPSLNAEQKVRMIIAYAEV
jgi:hypothetical protein